MGEGLDGETQAPHLHGGGPKVQFIFQLELARHFS